MNIDILLTKSVNKLYNQYDVSCMQAESQISVKVNVLHDHNVKASRHQGILKLSWYYVCIIYSLCYTNGVSVPHNIT